MKRRSWHDVSARFVESEVCDLCVQKKTKEEIRCGPSDITRMHRAPATTQTCQPPPVSARGKGQCGCKKENKARTCLPHMEGRRNSAVAGLPRCLVQNSTTVQTWPRLRALRHRRDYHVHRGNRNRWTICSRCAWQRAKSGMTQTLPYSEHDWKESLRGRGCQTALSDDAQGTAVRIEGNLDELKGRGQVGKRRCKVSRR